MIKIITFFFFCYFYFTFYFLTPKLYTEKNSFLFDYFVKFIDLLLERVKLRTAIDHCNRSHSWNVINTIS